MKYSISVFIFLNTFFMPMHCMDQDAQKQLVDSHAASTPTAPPAYNQNPYNNGNSVINNQSQSHRVPGAPLPSDLVNTGTGETFAQFWIRCRVPYRVQQLTKEAQIHYARSTSTCVICDEVWCSFSRTGCIAGMLCCCCLEEQGV